jgi:hypothetical protein
MAIAVLLALVLVLLVAYDYSKQILSVASRQVGALLLNPYQRVAQRAISPLLPATLAHLFLRGMKLSKKGQRKCLGYTDNDARVCWESYKSVSSKMHKVAAALRCQLMPSGHNGKPRVGAIWLSGLSSDKLASFVFEHACYMNRAAVLVLEQETDTAVLRHTLHDSCAQVMLLSVENLSLLLEARTREPSMKMMLHTVILIGQQQKQQEQFRFELATHKLHCLFYEELLRSTGSQVGEDSFAEEELPQPEDIAQVIYRSDHDTEGTPRPCWVSHHAAIAGVSSLRQLLRNAAPAEQLRGGEVNDGRPHSADEQPDTNYNSITAKSKFASSVAALAAAERAAARHANPDDVVYNCSGDVAHAHPANQAAIRLSLCLGGCVLLADDGPCSHVLPTSNPATASHPLPTFMLLRPAAVSELCELAVTELKAMHATLLLKLLLRAKGANLLRSSTHTGEAARTRQHGLWDSAVLQQLRKHARLDQCQFVCLVDGTLPPSELQLFSLLFSIEVQRLYTHQGYTGIIALDAPSHVEPTIVQQQLQSVNTRTTTSMPSDRSPSAVDGLVMLAGGVSIVPERVESVCLQSELVTQACLVGGPTRARPILIVTPSPALNKYLQQGEDAIDQQPVELLVQKVPPPPTRPLLLKCRPTSPSTPHPTHPFSRHRTPFSRRRSSSSPPS